MTAGRRILILGANGQVGRELQRAFAEADEILAFDRGRCDLTDSGQVRAAVRKAAPDVILNAAAYTAVDRAESERDLANNLNAVVPRILAEESQERDILLVHYSTDYIFDGAKRAPWVETDLPHPLNYYGATKLAGEQAITAIAGKHLIFRTSWVYGPHGRNFLLTMLRLGREHDRLTVVDDQTGAPTTSMALADATRAVVDGVFSGAFGPSEQWSGLYHMTCSGATTWYGFAREIFARVQRRSGQRAPEVAPISSDAWPTPAQRPQNSILSNEKLCRKFGVQLPVWQAELDRTLERLASETS